MSIRANSIRLFVSSTFTDFRREREILDADVFPHLQEYCSSRGYEFLPVDLRWGISEAESSSQQTLRICLNEVARCVQTSLRPYFLVLTGERYGWQPLPFAIPGPEFEKLLGFVVRQERQGNVRFKAAGSLLKVLYRMDLNQVPSRYSLRRREEVESITGESWTLTERRALAALRLAVQGIPLSNDAASKYFLSATAQEIWHGVLEKPREQADFKEHVLCFRRRRLGAPPSRSLPPDPAFVDMDVAGTPDAEAAALLAQLQRRLRSALGNNFLIYQWFQHDDERKDYERTFTADVTRLLMSIVEQELARLEQFRKDESEWTRHREFGQGHSKLVVGRRRLISTVDRLLDRRDGRGLIVHGSGGMGKTTLMAKVAAMALDRDPGLVPPRSMVTLQRYIGTTADSSMGQSLITSLVQELSSGTGLPWQPTADLRSLGNELRRQLKHAADNTPRGIALVLDGLDQLRPEDPARDFEWLPWPAPDNTALVVSVLDGDLLPLVQHRMSGAASLAVDRLGVPAAKEVLRSLLRESDRRLQTSQLRHVLDRFIADGAPLYLRIAANMAKKWPAFRNEKPATTLLAATTTELIAQYFADLANQGYGRPLVRKVIGLLVASRQGLTEQELVSLLWADASLQATIRASGEGGHLLTRLPMILWSRLRDDLEPYLVERAADGTVVLAFFHRLFEDAARKAFLATAEAKAETHRALANYFASDGDWLFKATAGHASRPKRRKLAELPYQLVALGEGEDLHRLLEDPAYRAVKVAAGQADELYGEFQSCDRLQMTAGKAHAREPLVALLSTHVIDQSAGMPAARVSDFVEALHVAFAYRRATSFYFDFLKACTARLSSGGVARSPLKAALEMRLANLHRRRFDLQLAESMLGSLMPDLRRRRLFAEVSRAEYDRAYIAFLRGEFDEAATAFLRSATPARRAGNAVSEWISLCLASNAKWIKAVSQRRHVDEAPHFMDVLNAAEPVFRRHVTLDVNATRWLLNVRQHRFRVAFRTGDLDLAVRMREEIRENGWARQYEFRDTDEVVLDGRLAMLKGEFERGADDLLRAARDPATATEALSELYFDIGFAYWRAGRRPQARKAWDAGMRLPAEQGNRPWQKLIEQARGLRHQ